MTFSIWSDGNSRLTIPSFFTARSGTFGGFSGLVAAAAAAAHSFRHCSIVSKLLALPRQPPKLNGWHSPEAASKWNRGFEARHGPISAANLQWLGTVSVEKNSQSKIESTQLFEYLNTLWRRVRGNDIFFDRDSGRHGRVGSATSLTVGFRFEAIAVSSASAVPESLTSAAVGVVKICGNLTPARANLLRQFANVYLCYCCSQIN